MQRLYKSRSNKVLDGVCGGIASYFKVDAILIRILWLIATIFIGQFFFGIIAYLVAMVIMPVEPKVPRVRSVEKKGENEETLEAENAPNYTLENSEQQVNDTYGQPSDPRSRSSIASILGLLFITFGVVMIVENIYDFNIWRWINLSMEYIWPSILIFIGLFLLFRRKS